MPDALVPQKHSCVIDLRHVDEASVSPWRREGDRDLVGRPGERLKGAIGPLKEAAELRAAHRANLDALLSQCRTGQQNLLELRGDEASPENLLAPRGRKIHDRLNERLDRDHRGLGNAHHDLRVPFKDACVDG